MNLKTVDLGGPMGYADFGGQGPPLVLLHGLAGSHLNWTQNGPALATRHRVYAPDLIGFGSTPRGGREASIQNHLSLFDRFLETVVGEPAVVVGHSMGGLITLLQGTAHPSAILRAVLVGPALPGPPTAALPGLERHLVPVLARAPAAGAHLARLQVLTSGVERVVRASMTHVTTPAAALPEEFIQAHIALEVERSGATDGYRSYLESWRSMHSLLVAGGAVDAAIRESRVPTLLIHGLHDLVVNVGAARRAHGMRPDWRYLELDDHGHSPQFQAPEEFNRAVLEFAART